MGAILVTLALVLALLTPENGTAADVPLAIVVHPDRQAGLSLEDVAQIYLRRRRFWDDGAPVVPLNLPSGTPLRARFSRLVLRQEETHLGEYWNRQYFYGILPPATLVSTEAVKRYVASDPNAIGYLPASEVDPSVRLLFHIE